MTEHAQHRKRRRLHRPRRPHRPSFLDTSSKLIKAGTALVVLLSSTFALVHVARTELAPSREAPAIRSDVSLQDRAAPATLHAYAIRV